MIRKIGIATVAIMIGEGMLKLNPDNVIGDIIAGLGVCGLLYAVFPPLQQKVENIFRRVCGVR